MKNEELWYPFGIILIIFVRKYHNYSIFIFHYSSFIRACCTLWQARQCNQKDHPGGWVVFFYRIRRGGPSPIGRGNCKSGALIPDKAHYSRPDRFRQSLESKINQWFCPVENGKKRKKWNKTGHFGKKCPVALPVIPVLFG